jgi:hypothetical protein
LLAVHWLRIEDVLNQTSDLSGKVIVTCSLPLNEDNTELVVGHTSSGAEELAKRIQGSGGGRVPDGAQRSAFGRVRSQPQGPLAESSLTSRRKTRSPSRNVQFARKM